MKNILDLKVSRPAVSVVAPTPLPAVPPEGASARAQSDAGEPERAATLTDADVPDELAWDAHAPYSAAARTRRHWLSWGLVGAGLVTAVIASSWSTGLVVLAGIGAWTLWERLGGPSKVRIGARGVTIDGHHTPHANLASFDMHQLRDGSRHLSLRTHARLARYIHIPLGEQDPDDLHDFLSRFIPEENHPVPFWEWWMRKS